MKHVNRTATYVVLIAALAGCGRGADDAVQTHVVAGTVHKADGTPLELGTIDFQPLQGGKANGLGAIQDGKFTLTMMLNGKRYDGVPAGKYRVIVTPRASSQDQQQANPLPIELPEPAVVESGKDNDLKLKLPR